MLKSSNILDCISESFGPDWNNFARNFLALFVVSIIDFYFPPKVSIEMADPILECAHKAEGSCIQAKWI